MTLVNYKVRSYVNNYEKDEPIHRWAPGSLLTMSQNLLLQL